MRVYGLVMVGVVLHGAGLARAEIITRHDVEDAAYLVEEDAYPALVAIGQAQGTLIDEHWVLTAAHVVAGDDPGDRTLVIGGQPCVVDRVVLHDRWVGTGLPGVAMREWTDLALLHLREPVRSVPPMALYTGDDEQGMRITFVGTGSQGNGRDGDLGRDMRLRCAHNRIDRVEADWLVIGFDAPPGGEALEGISGPGDSGGPGIVRVDGRALLAGVSSRNESGDRATCTYGSQEYYARVSSNLDWIRGVIDKGSEIGRVEAVGDQIEGDGYVYAAARAWIEAARVGDAQAFADFDREWIASGGRDERVDRWARMIERGRLVSVDSVARINQHNLVVYATFENTRRAIRFGGDMDVVGKLRGVSVKRIDYTERELP